LGVRAAQATVGRLPPPPGGFVTRSYTASHAVAERLAAADPGNAEWQRDLIVSNVKLAEVATAQDQQGRAAECYRAALAIAQRLTDAGRLAPSDAWMVDELERRLAATGAR
jgi:hypothetical protein